MKAIKTISIYNNPEGESSTADKVLKSVATYCIH